MPPYEKQINLKELGKDLMANVRIIPCLDVDNGRVVKGVNFVDLIGCRRSG